MKLNLRSISLFSLILAMTVPLSACGGSSKNNAASSQPTETITQETAQPSVAPKQKKEVKTFTVLISKDWVKSGWEAVQKDIDANAETLGFRLKFDELPSGNAGLQAIQVRFASGDLPDFFEHQSAYDVQTKLNGGKVLADISGDWVKNFPEALLKSKHYSYGGKIVGMPIDPTTLTGVFYNKKVFSDLGLQIPKTWDELLSISEKIKAAGKIPVYYSSKDAWSITMALNEGFIREYNEIPEQDLYDKLNTGKLKFSEMNLLKDVLVKSKDLVDKGYVQKTHLSDTYDNAQKALAEGTAAMLFQGSWVMDEINKKYPDQANDIGAFTMPFDDQGRSSMFVPISFFMTTKCSDAVLCKKVIEYLGSAETQQKFADAQPGLWTAIGVHSNLLPAVADLKKAQDEGRYNIWYGQQMTYPTDSPFATYLQEYYAGGTTVDKLLDATYKEMVKQAKSKNDPNFK